MRVGIGGGVAIGEKRKELLVGGNGSTQIARERERESGWRA